MEGKGGGPHEKVRPLEPRYRASALDSRQKTKLRRRGRAPSPGLARAGVGDVERGKKVFAQKQAISFALRRGTIAQVSTALDASLRAAEDELALNEAWLAR